MLRGDIVIGVLIGMMTAQVSQGQGYAMDIVYYASVNFTCNPDTTELDAVSNSSLQVPGNGYRLWILPNGNVLKPDSTGHKRVEVLDQGKMLHVRRVNDEDFGWYLCLVRISNPMSVTYVVDRHGINVGGPYFGDLTEKYRGMAVTGLISAAVCLVVGGLLCFFYNRQQAMLDKDPEELRAAMEAAEAAQAEQLRAASRGVAAEEEMTEVAAKKPVTQYTNLAYVPDEEDRKGKVEDAAHAQYAAVVHAEDAVAKKKGKAPLPPAGRELTGVVAGGGGGGGGDKAAATTASAVIVVSTVHKTKL